jgi:beta-glucosidase/6-phospho-beta-glucosidase/beta-galactosidase
MRRTDQPSPRGAGARQEQGRFAAQLRGPRIGSGHRDVLSPFLWATGIEDTFIAAPWHRTRRVMDEYELTDHYSQWATDLELMRELGVSAARYGLPWYRIQPAPARWSWEWADGVLGRMAELGIEPIIDLVHYGTPGWMERGFLAPDYPARVAEFASRLAERYRGGIRWFTPMNEPRITSWYCGFLGWWPPYARGWRGFAAVMLAACRGVVETEAALRAADRDVVILHVDATDLYRADDPALAPEAAHRQQLVFLALDLVSGRVDEAHPLFGWLLAQGIGRESLEWFRTHAVALDLVGLNMYPMFTVKRVERVRGRRRMRMYYGSGAMVETLAAMYFARYRRPMVITETASLGSIRRRRAWLDESVAAVRALRGRGVPVVGYTWWPLYSLVAWSYRQSTQPLERYWLRMGLWDIDPRRGQGLRRVPTPLVDAYRELVAAGDGAVGPLAAPGAATG